MLEQTLKPTQDRFNVGEVTRTDVAQSEAQLAAGRHAAAAGTSYARHHQGELPSDHRQRPRKSGGGIAGRSSFCPSSLVRAIDQGLIENPNVTAAMYGIDVSFLNVKVNEGALFPTLTFQGSVQQAYEACWFSRVHSRHRPSAS